MTQSPDHRPVVAHVVKTMSLGGVQRVLKETLSCVDQTRWHPIVLCMERRGEWGDELAESGLQVDLFDRPYPWRKMLSSKMRALPAMVRWLKTNRVSVLHLHLTKATLFMVTAARLARVPCVILHHHALYRDHYWKNLSPRRLRQEAKMARRADAIIAVSESVADCTSESLGLARESIHVIPNAGISSQTGQKKPGLPLPDVPEDGKVIGAMGRLVPDKCFEDFIDAAALVLQRHPDCRFWLAGDEKGGESVRNELEAQVSRLGIGDRFQMLGFRNDLQNLLAHIDIGVLCSRTEGCPVALLEFLGAGKPVAVSDIPSLTNIVKDSESGLVVPLHDAKALAGAIEHLITDEPLAQSLAQTGQAQVAGYTWPEAVRRYEALYTSVLKSKSV